MRHHISRVARAMGVAALFVVPTTSSGAQQVCKPATPLANLVIKVFLNEPREQPFLQSRGITAKNVAQLQPLTDANDAALCARMDSTMAQLPAHYYRTDSTIIGTDLSTVPDPAVHGVSIEPGPRVFVHDGAGNRIYAEGEGGSPPKAPIDLRATVSAPGMVRIEWSNAGTPAASHRLQRADSAGITFVDVGTPLSGSATFIIDSSAVTGTLYHYRLRTTWTTSVGYSNVFHHRIILAGTLARTSSGLLFHDTFTRANGAPGTGWAVESGSWAISNNALEVSVASYASYAIRLAGIADRKDVHVQLRTSRRELYNYATIYTRRSGSNWYQGDLGSTGEGNRPRAHRSTAGAFTLLGFGTFASQADSMHRLTFSTVGTQRRLWAGNRLEVNATDSVAANDVAGTVALGVYAGGGTGVIRFDDVVVCASRTVSVNGLTPGLRIRVGGHSSGPAIVGTPLLLDLLGTALPAPTIEVLDPYSVVISSLAPTGGICGGDTFSWS